MYREAKYLFHFEGTKLVPLSKWALMNYFNLEGSEEW